MMSCNEVLEAMHRYLDGELDEREVTGFESHLLDCATCRAEHSRWQEAVDVIRGAREAYRPPESSERRVLELVRQAEQQAQDDGFSGLRIRPNVRNSLGSGAARRR